MRTLRVSDDVHRELTRLRGEMMAQSGKPQTFSHVIEALVSRSVLLPPELIRHVEEFIEANKQLGYTTREEFIREAINEALNRLSGKYQCLMNAHTKVSTESHLFRSIDRKSSNLINTLDAEQKTIFLALVQAGFSMF